MIVSCPSCDSKYQVADEKVAGSMLRTRCKACGAQIVVDGTNPPPPGGAEGNSVTQATRPEDRPRLSETPAPGKSKPPPPHRSTMPTVGATAKPPPPARARTQTGSHPIHSDKPDAASKRPVIAVNSEDALDPNASSSDFYAKLLSKVGSPKTVSQPAPAEPGATKRSDAPHPGHLNSDAPAGDFYSKILAKVKPPKSEPPAASPPNTPKLASEHKTLPPPSWGPQPQEHQLGPEATANRAMATAPVHAPQPAAPEPFSPTKTAHGLGEIDIHVDFGGDAAPGAPAGHDTQQVPDAAAGSHLAPLPPKRSEPPLPAGIQLPPITNPFTESRPPAANPQASVATAASPTVSASAPPPQNTVPPSKTEATLEPSIKSTAAAQNAQSDSEPYPPRPQKRMAGMIAAVLGVGLLGVGGGVAATIYALKPSLNAARVGVQPAAASAQVVVAAASPSATPTPPQPPSVAASAAPSQSQAATEAPERQKESPETSEKVADKGAGAKAPRSASAGAHAAPTPVVAAEPRKEPATKPPTPTDSNIAALLDAKSAGKTNTKTGLPPAPAQTPSKGGGSGPFPKDVAMAMLGVAASQAPACKKPGGPTGTGKAIVTFDTDGQVVITNIVGEGFPGTPTAQCVAGLFRRVRVPPFGGDRATAAKIFVIPP